jgi:hypothetical protein
MKENNNQKTIQKIKAGGNIKIGKSYKPEVELNSTENINEIQNIETEKEVEILEDYVPKMVFKKEELVSSSKFEETKVLTKETGSEEQYQEEIDQKVSEEMVEKTKKLEILNKEEISNVVFSINENIDKIKA